MIGCIVEKKTGSSHARNRGIKAARYDTLAFIDDDCRADKNWVKEILIFFKKNGPNTVMTGKNLNAAPNNLLATFVHYATELYFKNYLYEDNHRFYSLALDSKNFAIKKNLLTKNHIYFDPSYPAAEDVDLGFQLQKLGCKIILNQKAVVFHHGKTGLFSALKGVFLKGAGTERLIAKWGKQVLHQLLKNETLVTYWLQKDYFLKKTKFELTKNLSFISRLLFYLFQLIVFFVGKVGFYYSRAGRFFTNQPLKSS